MLDVIYDLAPDEMPEDVQGDLLIVLFSKECDFCPKVEQIVRRMCRRSEREFLISFLWGNTHEELYEEFMPSDYPYLLRYRNGVLKDQAEGYDDAIDLLEEFLRVPAE